MSKRLSSAERKTQIASATLDLLADLPVAELTTRRIAKKVGISQPALFRHFRSREQILHAAVCEARGELARGVASILEDQGSALDAIAPLVTCLLEFAEQRPGLPRLLSWVSVSGAGVGPEADLALRHLRSLQGNLFSQLVAQGKQERDVPPAVDEALAAEVLVAGVQGLIQQWELDRRAAPLTQKAGALVALWLAGLRAGQPASVAVGEVSEAEHSEPLRSLDVRPQIAAGRDPLDVILGAVEATSAEGLLVLTTPFRPRPLEALLGRKGHRVEAREVGPKLWEVLVFGSAAQALKEWADLPAPEPMERCLEHLQTHPPGRVLLARVPRLPRLLLGAASARGWECWGAVCPDGSAIFAGRRP